MVEKRSQQCSTSFRAGFTIVELLIVVVIIGILAAITLVSYNGIQGRAQQSVAKEAVNQAVGKVMAYAALNNDVYPATLADATVNGNDSTTYEYSVNNTSSPKTFCVTATIGNKVSYFANNTTQSNPATGGCPGHGQNGAIAITNLAPNPSIEADLATINNYAGPGGVANLTRETTGAHDGTAYARQSWTAAQTGVSAFGPQATVISLTPAATYSAGVWVRSSKSQRLNVSIEWYTISDGFAGLTYGTPITIPANTWTRLENIAAVAPAGAVKGVLFVRNNNPSGGDGTLWANGDTFDVDGILFIRSAVLYGFADGNTAAWIWNGTTNSSTSTGPAI